MGEPSLTKFRRSGSVLMNSVVERCIPIKWTYNTKEVVPLGGHSCVFRPFRCQLSPHDRLLYSLRRSTLCSLGRFVELFRTLS
jgi:hypothetical protein